MTDFNIPQLNASNYNSTGTNAQFNANMYNHYSQTPKRHNDVVMTKNTFPNIQTQQSEPLDLQTLKIREGHHSKRASNKTTNES